ncbi:MAG: HEAT repeat domain-containing protein [Anaerolineae bacterium]|jgi:HEAT repeat protein|nr:HEAT repeat domain-containing protein [Anaerolineae bacterium]
MSDVNTQSQAILALKGRSDQLPYLIDRLRVETDVMLREDLTFVLVSLGAIAIPPLIALLRDTDSQVRHHAAHVLGKIGASESVEALIACLEDPDVTVITKAALALGQIGDPQAIPALIARFDHPDLSLQTMLDSVLIGFDVAALPHLHTALGDVRPVMRERSAEVLGNIAADESLPYLSAAIGDPIDAVRFAAAMALVQMGAVTILRDHREDSDPRVQALIRRVIR